MTNFRESVLKVTGPRVHKVNNSFGVYDAYKYIRKNKWFNIGKPITEHQFYYIVRNINNLLADSIIEGHDVNLPCKMGKLEVRKRTASITYTNGKIKNNLPIDWDKTLKLWAEDEESYKKKTLIKMEEKEIFKINYNKITADYNNKSFYEFKANRDLKQRLKQRIKNNDFDAFKLW